MLEPERARQVIWVVAQNPAGWAFAFGNGLLHLVGDRAPDARRDSYLGGPAPGEM